MSKSNETAINPGNTASAAPKKANLLTMDALLLKTTRPIQIANAHTDQEIKAELRRHHVAAERLQVEANEAKRAKKKLAAALTQRAMLGSDGLATYADNQTSPTSASH